MDPDTHGRMRMSPRSIVLGAIEAATAAGGCDDIITEYWSHARLVARIAGELSAVTAVDPSEVAGAALLHDVGELLLLARHPEEYAAIRPPARAHHLQLELEQAASAPTTPSSEPSTCSTTGSRRDRRRGGRSPRPVPGLGADHARRGRRRRAIADEPGRTPPSTCSSSRRSRRRFLLLAERSRTPRHVGAQRSERRP